MGRWKFRTETEVSEDAEKRNGEKRSGVPILFKIRQKTGQKERRLFDTINVRSFFPWRDKTMDKEGE